VCLHGFADTWRIWELVLPTLERHHEVLALTLAGHAGGPPIEGEVTEAVLADAVERAMEEAGFGIAHLVGNSLGGFVALQLAARRRARSVVALAAPHAEAILSTTEDRRRATRRLIDHARRVGRELDAERIACPVRIVWGTEDRLLPWPSAAARFRGEWLPHADWVVLDGVGHCPQLDVPLETSELILGFTT
jgi:pimeloyl-ACP methyl ester carboxylesterase